jgi:hypothetical protein
MSPSRPLGGALVLVAGVGCATAIVEVNGMRSMCGGSLPEKIDGGYYFEFGAAMDGTTYTSFYWYTS